MLHYKITEKTKGLQNDLQDQIKSDSIEHENRLRKLKGSLSVQLSELEYKLIEKEGEIQRLEFAIKETNLYYEY